MTMRAFALTYPQLMSQALAQGLDDASMRRLRQGYELTEELFDGFYRGQGMPFVCHLVRTGSIVLAEGRPVSVVLAAMLHASYMLQCFQHAKSKTPAPARAQLQSRVGTDVEALIWGYEHLPWYKIQDLQAHVAGAATMDATTRDLLVMRLANELEDYLDLAMAYRGSAPFRQKIEERGELTIALARGLGLAQLGDELKAAYGSHLSARLPETVLRNRRNAYESPARQWARTPLTRRIRLRIEKLITPGRGRA